jgi:hypothetical protein
MVNSFKGNATELVLAMFKRNKLNFGDLSFVATDVYDVSFDFNISPQDFLKFGKKDFLTNDNRGNINCLTNSKRAIDCQTDRILAMYGINIEKFPDAAIQFIRQTSSVNKLESRAALRLIQALGIAPIDLISKARLLRHKLEHYYEIPNREETRESLELAELFINATEHKVYLIWSYYFGNHIDGDEMYNYIDVVFDLEEKCFSLTDADKESITITADDVMFYYFLKIGLYANDVSDIEDIFKQMLANIAHPIPMHNIKVS